MLRYFGGITSGGRIRWSRAEIEWGFFAGRIQVLGRDLFPVAADGLIEGVIMMHCPGALCWSRTWAGFPHESWPV